MLQNTSKSKIGDCDACTESVNVKITLSGRNMWLCDACLGKEIEINRQISESTRIIESSHQIDNSIQLSQDIYNAKTVAIIELEAAINADESIPADQKQLRFAKECQERFFNLRKVIFEKRQELLEAENELRVLQTATQDAAGKLRTELREQFKDLDVTYVPTVVKKPSKSGKGVSKKFDLNAVKVAAAKYGVDATLIQMMMVKNLYKSEDEAGQALARTKVKKTEN